MNSKLISGVTEFLNTESELIEVSYEANITPSPLLYGLTDTKALSSPK